MSSPEWNTKLGNILVVDDNEMNRDSLSRRLQRHGYLVSTAEGGRQALELLNEQSFDLVLLDIMMPHMSDIEVLSEIRQASSPIELPVSHMLRDSLGNGSVIYDEDRRTVASPASVLQKLNLVFPMERSDSLYFTPCYGILDSETGIFQFACAGHECPVLCKNDGTIVRLSSSVITR